MQQDGFGCAVTNRFDRLLDDEADPFDILQEAEQQKQKQKQIKKDELRKANAAKRGKKESQKDKKIHNSDDGGLGNITDKSGWKRAPRGGHVQNENLCVAATKKEEWRVVFRERRSNPMEGPQQFPADASQDRWDKGNRQRDWGRGTGEGYPRNSDRFLQGTKKEYDSRDQSNWVIWRPGNEHSDAKEVQDAVEPEGQTRVEGEETEQEAASAVAVEMSLDEWKALQEQSRPKEELNLRKVDARVPSKAMVIHKSKPVEEKGEIEEDEDAYVFRRPANDITARLAFNFGKLPRPRRGGRGFRGGRGGQGGRGGRGGQGGQGETEQPECAPGPPPPRAEVVSAPDPDDPEDFPALG